VEKMGGGGGPSPHTFGPKVFESVGLNEDWVRRVVRTGLKSPDCVEKACLGWLIGAWQSVRLMSRCGMVYPPRVSIPDLVQRDTSLRWWILSLL
jgi:hypothetical protein